MSRFQLGILFKSPSECSRVAAGGTEGLEIGASILDKPSISKKKIRPQCQLVHHAAAANNNSRVVVWVNLKETTEGKETEAKSETAKDSEATASIEKEDISEIDDDPVGNDDDGEESKAKTVDESQEQLQSAPALADGSTALSISDSSSPPATLCYASHAILHLCQPQTHQQQSVWSVHETLRSAQCDQDSSIVAGGAGGGDDAKNRAIITCLAVVRDSFHSTAANMSSTLPSTLVCGFSSGAIVLWRQVATISKSDNNNNVNNQNKKRGKIWKEYTIQDAGGGGRQQKQQIQHKGRSITVLDAIWVDDYESKPTDDKDDGSGGEPARSLLIVTGSSAGAYAYTVRLPAAKAEEEDIENEKRSAGIGSSHRKKQRSMEDSDISAMVEETEDDEDDDEDDSDDEDDTSRASSVDEGVDSVPIPKHQALSLSSESSTTVSPLLETTAVSSVRIQSFAFRNGNNRASEVAGNNNGNKTDYTLVLVGTAAPRHNKIHVYQIQQPQHPKSFSKGQQKIDFHHAGALTGHEDWVTCFDWFPFTNNDALSAGAGSKTNSVNKPDSQSWLLASGSQDCRIRLWNFTTRKTDPNKMLQGVSSPIQEEEEEGDDEDDDDEDNADEEEEEEGESRLDIHCVNSSTKETFVTSVTLETLLLGHVECVTSVKWHPNPQTLYKGHNMLLISSSMDRSILLWSPALEDGIWIPLSRVGSAGGIIGGPMGSSLLGYCQALVEPMFGRNLVGHAYGGALHVWQVEGQKGMNSAMTTDQSSTPQYEADSNGDSPVGGGAATSGDVGAAIVKWRATPCITGHFGGVTDLSWEALNGDYLATVSQDQTCRLWAPLRSSSSKAPPQSSSDDEEEGKDEDGGMDTDSDQDSTWVEVARPQVHGYSLAAVTSISRPECPHELVTGADEKELRVFDAPLSTLRILKAAAGVETKGGQENDDKRGKSSKRIGALDRVERAYLPALGLSNKASAEGAVEQEQLTEEGEEEDMAVDASRPTSEGIALPLERDLGSISIWPETSKLFGHTSELYCLASTLFSYGSDCKKPLVASSAKARTPEDAVIRLWDLESGSCLQALECHKSTVATLCFSPDGRHLASSGKDRRLCIWRCKGGEEEQTQQTFFGWGRKSTHGGEVKKVMKPDFFLGWSKESAHKRIIWSVHFCPFRPDILASGSRDGCISIWKIVDFENEAIGYQVTTILSFTPAHHNTDGKPDSVTALSFCPRDLSPERDLALLAVGLESGRIELWTVPLIIEEEKNEHDDMPTQAAMASLSMIKDRTAELVLSFDVLSQCHAATITRLAWRPCSTANSPNLKVQKYEYLASSSMDHGCRIFRIDIGDV